MQVWGGLHRLHAQLWGELSRHMETQVGVSLLEHGCTYELATAPQRRLRMVDLAALLELSRSGLTRLVDRLEVRAWVRRETPTHDRRSTYVVLTGEGARAYQRNNEPFRRMVTETISARLGDRAVADLQRILSELPALARPATPAARTTRPPTPATDVGEQ